MLFTDEDLDRALAVERAAEAASETARQEEIRITGLAYSVEYKARALASHYAKTRRAALEAQASGSPDTVYAPLLAEARRVHESKKLLDAEHSYLSVFATGDAELDLRRKQIELLMARRMVLQIRGERLRSQTEQAIGAAATDSVIISFPNDSQAVRWLQEAASLTAEVTMLQAELATRTKAIDAMKNDAAPQLWNI